MLRREQHGRAIVRAQEPYAFFGDFGELEQRHHLEAAVGVSYGARIDDEGGITDPPLSTTVSMSPCGIIPPLGFIWASTCEYVMWPRLQFVGAADGIQCCLSWLEASRVC